MCLIICPLIVMTHWDMLSPGSCLWIPAGEQQKRGMASISAACLEDFVAIKGDYNEKKKTLDSFSLVRQVSFCILNYLNLERASSKRQCPWPIAFWLPKVIQGSRDANWRSGDRIFQALSWSLWRRQGLQKEVICLSGLSHSWLMIRGQQSTFNNQQSPT